MIGSVTERALPPPYVHALRQGLTGKSMLTSVPVAPHVVAGTSTGARGSHAES